MTPRVREILTWYGADSPGTLTSLARLLNHGRLAGTGKLVILPVDQGFEHGPARSFAPNPVNRQANGTPDRQGKGTLFWRSGQACPGSEREGPARVAQCPHEHEAARVGGACLPTGAGRGGAALQVRFLKRQLSLPVSMISQ